MISTTLPYNSKSTIQWGWQFLLYIYITGVYEYFIFVESLSYKVLIFWFCGLFGGNRLLVLTTFPYKSNSAIQWGCQILLIVVITDLYAHLIFVESLRYKVLIFCLCGSFGKNSLLILTTLSYNINSAIQWGCRLLLKLYITCAGHLAETAYFLLILIKFPYKSILLLLPHYPSSSSLVSSPPPRRACGISNTSSALSATCQISGLKVHTSDPLKGVRRLYLQYRPSAPVCLTPSPPPPPSFDALAVEFPLFRDSR